MGVTEIKKKYLWIEIIPFGLFLFGFFENEVLLLNILYLILAIKNIVNFRILSEIKIGKLRILNLFALIIAISFSITFYRRYSIKEITGKEVYLYIGFIVYMLSYFRISLLKNNAPNAR